jgi:hypothetical protein
MAGLLRLRPHHLIDLVTDYGRGRAFVPHPYGHAVHVVARRVVEDRDVEIAFVLAADDICRPCRHLQPDVQCDDVLYQLSPPTSKQAYNDELDAAVLAHLGLQPGARLSLSEFLAQLRQRAEGIAAICAHPGEAEADRLAGLIQGLDLLADAPA